MLQNQICVLDEIGIIPDDGWIIKSQVALRLV